MTTPGQYGGPGPGGGGQEEVTRPVPRGSGGYPPPPPAPPQGPQGTQYQPPVGYGGHPEQGGYAPPPPAPGQYGGSSGGWPPPQPGGWPQPAGAPYQPPPARSGSSTGLIIGIVVAVLLLAGGGAWYFLAGPGSEAEGAATPTASGSRTTAPTTTPASSGSSSSPGSGGLPGIPPGSDTGGDVSIDVAVGECITLGGTINNATADPAGCGSRESNYKVIAKTPSADDCPADADQTFYETLGGIEQGALCLDIDWVEGDCFELSGEDPQRVACTTPGTQTVRVLETIQGTSDLNRCDEGGFPYADRNFIVCAEEV